MRIENREAAIQPASIDLHLGENFSFLRADPFKKALVAEARAVKPWTPDREFTSQPQTFALVHYEHMAKRLGIAGAKLDAMLAPAKFDLDVSDLFLILQPNECFLAHTLEHVTLAPHLRGVVHGKSRYNRLFVSMNAGGGYIDPGFSGQITLGIQNESQNRTILQIGAPICQIEITRLVSPAARPYGHPTLGSSYQNTTGAVAAR